MLASARELGKRYATAMQQLQTQNIASAKAPIVVLCFDDAEISHYTIVAPLLKKYGFDATFHGLRNAPQTTCRFGVLYELATNCCVAQAWF